eukprot:TRINITY_DN206_c0_g1_i7.p1 TRINITY_DN206_c0_g1~~TRINITY_DN206_c0_g1_i7.p1  ORF type:complete len:565 (-),score=219.10 TRINITY_DN206_c0_g1_i7:494-2188(-)
MSHSQGIMKTAGVQGRGDFRRRALEHEERRRQARGASTEGMVMRREGSRPQSQTVRTLRPVSPNSKPAAATTGASSTVGRSSQPRRAGSFVDEEPVQNVLLSTAERASVDGVNSAAELTVRPKLIHARSPVAFCRSPRDATRAEEPVVAPRRGVDVGPPERRCALFNDDAPEVPDVQRVASLIEMHTRAEPEEEAPVIAEPPKDEPPAVAEPVAEHTDADEAAAEPVADDTEQHAQAELDATREQEEEAERLRVKEEINRLKEAARAKASRVKQALRQRHVNAGEVEAPAPEPSGIYDGGADALTPSVEWDIAADVEGFLFTPPPPGVTVQCRIEREKKFLKSNPVYAVYLESNGQCLLAARKRTKKSAANYVISLDRKDLSRQSPNYVGKLRSNVLGTEWVFYDRGHNPEKLTKESGCAVRQELGAVLYGTNVLGGKGPRKMKIAVPAVVDCDRRAIWQPLKKDESMLEKFKADDFEDLISLHNKAPVWNDAIKSYVLNFHHRVKKPSIKNFQVCAPEDPTTVMMQFGRMTSSSFCLDFSYPLSLFQAFSIALSSFDTKLACE